MNLKNSLVLKSTIVIPDGLDLPLGRAIDIGISLLKVRLSSLVMIGTKSLFIRIMAMFKMLFRLEEAEMIR